MIVDEKGLVDQFKDYIVDEKATITSESSSSTAATVEEEEEEAKPLSKGVESHQRSTIDRRGPSASPLARSLAKERGIDLSSITGTGPGGRIIKTDILSSASTRVPLSDLEGSRDARIRYTDLPLSNMRKTIAERLSLSMQTIPHYYLTIDDLSMTMVLRARSQLNADAASLGIKLSINDFVVKAAAMALRSVPQVNCSWLGDKIRQFDTVDVCVAVATEAGLITPIVKDADTLGLLQLSKATKELAERAKAGKLAPTEYQGGTFTISNLGMLGIGHFTAIINPPQSAILAVGKVTEDERMSVTLSCDHRVIDGATGATWLASFRNFLEEPFKLLL